MQKSAIKPFDENEADQYADLMTDFPFDEIIARLDGEKVADGNGCEPADFIKKFFLHVTAVDLTEPNASRCVGKRFFAAIKKIQPELLKGVPNAIR